MEDAVQNAKGDYTADRLMDIHRKCTKISTDHGARRAYVVKTAADALIQHEVKQKEKTATRPSTPHHIPSKKKAQYQLIETLKIYSKTCKK